MSRYPLYCSIRWGCVFGPLTALIATLAQYKWFCRSMDRWYGPDGFAYKLTADADTADKKKFIEFVCTTVYQHVWAKATSHEGGTGLDSGPHPTSFKLLNRWRRFAPKLAKTLEVILAGGYWSPDRYHKIHPCKPGHCPRCWADNADIVHMFLDMSRTGLSRRSGG